MSLIPTPNGVLPPELTNDVGPGKLRSVDGRRIVEINSREGALELCSYATLAVLAGNRAQPYVDQTGRGRGRGSDVSAFARLNALAAQRQVATILPIMADVYWQQGLSVDTVPQWMADRDMDWTQIHETQSGYTATFSHPQHWKEYAADLDARVSEQIRMVSSEADVERPMQMGGAPAVAGYILLVVLGGAIVGAIGYGVYKLAHEVMAYFRAEQLMLKSRFDCFDANLERWLATGDERAHEAMLRCHEQAEGILARDTARWTAIAIGVGTTGAVILGALAYRAYGKRRPA